MNAKEKFNAQIELIEQQIKDADMETEDVDIISILCNGILSDGERLSSVFQYLTGKTLRKYIKERRIMAAYDEISSSGILDWNKILDLSGFETQNSVEREFQKNFDKKPSEIARDKDRTYYKAPLTWEKLSDESIARSAGPETENNRLISISVKDAETVIEINSLKSIYDFSEDECNIAFSLSNKYGISLKSSFAYTDDFISHCHNNSAKPIDDIDRIKELIFDEADGEYRLYLWLRYGSSFRVIGGLLKKGIIQEKGDIPEGFFEEYKEYESSGEKCKFEDFNCYRKVYELSDRTEPYPVFYKKYKYFRANSSEMGIDAYKAFYSCYSQFKNFDPDSDFEEYAQFRKQYLTYDNNGYDDISFKDYYATYKDEQLYGKLYDAFLKDGKYKYFSTQPPLYEFKEIYDSLPKENKTADRLLLFRACLCYKNNDPDCSLEDFISGYADLEEAYGSYITDRMTGHFNCDLSFDNFYSIYKRFQKTENAPQFPLFCRACLYYDEKNINEDFDVFLAKYKFYEQKYNAYLKERNNGTTPVREKSFDDLAAETEEEIAEGAKILEEIVRDPGLDEVLRIYSISHMDINRFSEVYKNVISKDPWIKLSEFLETVSEFKADYQEISFAFIELKYVFPFLTFSIFRDHYLKNYSYWKHQIEAEDKKRRFPSFFLYQYADLATLWKEQNVKEPYETSIDLLYCYSLNGSSDTLPYYDYYEPYFYYKEIGGKASPIMFMNEIRKYLLKERPILPGQQKANTDNTDKEYQLLNYVTDHFCNNEMYYYLFPYDHVKEDVYAELQDESSSDPYGLEEENDTVYYDDYEDPGEYPDETPDEDPIEQYYEDDETLPF